ncbi:acetyl-CoA hydrolase/transferase family protein [Desulfospira joergensenii]|uniref:acetyl-CoA hydrolase/transferase family protein n=1 Tax=Desulfospira joergensenii TaxID=53329 RepID=UPI0003B566A9|nr:acetyl-CoA hydrolase/transferase C-terminal domain-containing protein [Desulfospira joergensenii]
MKNSPAIIKLGEIGETIEAHLGHRKNINCYIGSNAATPTASIEALTEAIKAESGKLPFMKMLHILLHGPIPYVEEGLQDRVKAYSIFSGGEVRKAADEGRAYYLPCTLGTMDRLIGKECGYAADLVIMKVSQNPGTGEYSLGLSVDAVHAALESASLVIAELDPSMPFTHGQSVIAETDIDYIIKDGIKPVYSFDAPDFENLGHEEKRIGELITEHFLEDGMTLQTGIGKIPDAVVGVIAGSGYKDLGAQTELYGDGLMYLQKKGIINNKRKKINTGYSTTSLVMGSRELYDYVNGRSQVQMRPCMYTNAAHTIQACGRFLSVNTAIGVDLTGNVWADFIDPKKYYGGVGGQPDFVRALAYKSFGTPIIAMKTRARNGQAKIVPACPSGITLTASAYDGIVLVTEYGIADLRDLTMGFKGLAIAAISHPDHREELMKSIHEDPRMTKPKGFSLDKIPPGVTLYNGKTPLP